MFRIVRTFRSQFSLFFLLLSSVSVSSVCHAEGLPASATPAPVLSAVNAVCSPQIAIDHETSFAGHAFLVAGQPTLLVTAQHIFGPDGGLTRSIPWQAMPAHAHILSCDLITGNTPLHAATALAIPGAIAFDSPVRHDAENRDVAAFTVPENHQAALKIAQTPLHDGDRVWLISDVVDSDTVVHPARFVEQKDGLIFFSYDTNTTNFRATSGAPIVNAQGEVVGINLGRRYDEKRHLRLGMAVSYTVLNNVLKTGMP